jgi:hypothetical protein
MLGGGLLGIFPAGEVLPTSSSAVTDSAWTRPRRAWRAWPRPRSSGLLPRENGRSSTSLACSTGHAHVLLARQHLNKQNTSLKVAIGSAIPFSRLDSSRTRTATGYLACAPTSAQPFTRDNAAPSSPSRPCPRACPAQDWCARVRRPALLGHPGGQRAVSACQRQGPAPSPACCTRSAAARGELPRGGRGHGQGRGPGPLDHDYDHLNLWHKENAESRGYASAGARPARAQGPGGLYTATLVQVKKAFWKHRPGP